MEIVVAILLFGLAFIGMSLGIIFKGRSISGSCGGAHGPRGEDLGLGACACGKKDASVCPSENDLIRIAQLGNPDPDHHR